jgi:hypothetical protein
MRRALAIKILTAAFRPAALTKASRSCGVDIDHARGSNVGSPAFEAVTGALVTASDVDGSAAVNMPRQSRGL